MTKALATIVAVLVATSCTAGSNGVNVHEVGDGTPPPTDAELASVEYPDVAAWIARESDAGRPVVLNIFASWCEPCRAEMPLLLAAADEHPDITFAGVDHLDNRDDGQAFIDDFNVDFPTFHDLTGDVAAWVRGRGMPTTAFFDASGRLVHTTSGPVTRVILDEQLPALEASIPDE